MFVSFSQAKQFNDADKGKMLDLAVGADAIEKEASSEVLIQMAVEIDMSNEREVQQMRQKFEDKRIELVNAERERLATLLLSAEMTEEGVDECVARFLRVSNKIGEELTSEMHLAEERLRVGHAINKNKKIAGMRARQVELAALMAREDEQRKTLDELESLDREERLIFLNFFFFNSFVMFFQKKKGMRSVRSETV